MSVSPHKAVIQTVEAQRKADSPHIFTYFLLCLQSKHPLFKGFAPRYAIISMNSRKHNS